MVAAVVISSTVAFLVMYLTYRCLGITMLLDVENLKMALEVKTTGTRPTGCCGVGTFKTQFERLLFHFKN